VFASCLQTPEQLAANQKFSFRFYGWDAKQQKEIEVKEILIGTRTLSVSELSEQYFEEYVTYLRENRYWQNNERKGRIEKTATRLSEKKKIS